MPRVAVPDDVQEAIVNATMSLMERYGYKKMTMEDIAQEARIGKATIYSYFNSKEEVAIAVIDRYQKCLQDQWREILLKDNSPEQRLREMILTQVLFGFDKAQRYHLSVDETLSSLRHIILPRREKYQAELAQLLVVVLQEGCGQGLFRCVDIELTAQTILTCVSGLGPSNLSPCELGRREEIEARTQRVIDLILNGIRIN